MANKYYLTKEGHIAEYIPDLHPEDPLLDGTHDMNGEIPRFFTKEEKPLTSEKIAEMRAEMTSVVPVARDEKEGVYKAGRVKPENADGFYIRTADASHIRHSKYDYGGRKNKLSEEQIEYAVKADEAKIREELRLHNEILKGVYDVTLHRWDGQTQRGYVKYGEPDFTGEDDTEIRAVKYLGEFDSYKDCKKDYEKKARLQDANPFLYHLYEPTILEEDGKKTLSMGLEVPRELGEQIEKDYPGVIKERMFWTLNLQKEKAEGKDGSRKDKMNYQIHWEDPEVGKSGNIQVRGKYLASLKAGIRNFAEDISHSGPSKPRSLSAWADVISDYAVYPDFPDAEEEWEKARKEKRLGTKEFAEQWLRSGHSLYNDYTLKTIVPKIDEKTGALKCMYQMEITRDDRDKVQKDVEAFRARYGREPEDPIGSYVLKLKEAEGKNSVSRIKKIPVTKISERAEKITQFPKRNGRGGHGGSIEDIQTDDTTLINAHWGLDKVERLYEWGHDTWQQKLSEEVKLQNKRRETPQLSLAEKNIYTDAREQDAYDISKEQEEKERETEKGKPKRNVWPEAKKEPDAEDEPYIDPNNIGFEDEEEEREPDAEDIAETEDFIQKKDVDVDDDDGLGDDGLGDDALVEDFSDVFRAVEAELEGDSGKQKTAEKSRAKENEKAKKPSHSGGNSGNGNR